MPRIEHGSPAWIDDVLAGLRPAHPRLLLDAPARARIAAARAHPVGSTLWSLLVQRGEQHLAEQPGDARTGVNGSRVTLDRVYTLGLLAQVTGESQWAARAIAEALTLTGGVSWAGPSEWLARAERMHAMAIVLDWCAPWLGDNRAAIVQALIHEGLDAADHAYACRMWWWRDVANWNAVCNGGVIIACLALAEERPAQCRRLLGYALEGLPLHLARMAPDGGHEEGAGYWAYTWRFVSSVVSCLDTALGHDFGLSAAPWLAQSASFRIHHEGPTGRFFGWGDTYRDAPFDPNLLWLALRYDQPAAAAAALRALPLAHQATFFGAAARALISWTDGAGAEQLALSARFRGPEVALVRTAWTADATWVGLKGGDVQAPHAHRDLGAVVIDAAGVRWIDDPGAGDYGDPRYWHGRPDSPGTRWEVFACAAEGHSTLLVEGRGCDLLSQMRLVPGHECAVTTDSAFADRGVARWTRRLADLKPGIVEIADELECTQLISVLVQWVSPWAATMDGQRVRLLASAQVAELAGPEQATSVTLIEPVAGWTVVRFAVNLLPGKHRLLSRLTVAS